MGVLVAILLVVPTAALAAPPADRVQLFHDLGPEHVTRAGTVNTFGWVLLTEDGAPAFHQDAVFEVRFDNRTLLKTTPSSGHDYDGIDTYQVTFPHEGTFTVRATVHDDGTTRTKTLNGTVLPQQAAPLRLSIDAPETTPTGEPTTIEIQLETPATPLPPNVDIQVHVRRTDDAFETLKTTLHTTTGHATLPYTFDRTGTFELTAIATPTGPAPNRTHTPTTQTVEITATENPTPPGPPTPTTKQPLTNARETSNNDDRYTLHGTYDPYTTIGPYGRIRLGAIATHTATDTLARNVNYTAELTDPYGRTLLDLDPTHRPSGVFELTVSQATLGQYTLSLEANKGDWTDTITLTYGVLPPTLADDPIALLANPNTTQTPQAGHPFSIPIHVTHAGGQPAQHTEVDWRILNTTGIPVSAGKLHTHTNATFPLTVTFPTEGSYQLETLPGHLEPAPTLFMWGPEPGQRPITTLAVEPGPGLDDRDQDSGDEEPPDQARQTPGLLLGVFLASLALAALHRKH